MAKAAIQLWRQAHYQSKKASAMKLDGEPVNKFIRGRIMEAVTFRIAIGNEQEKESRAIVRVAQRLVRWSAG